ncbi:MAG: GNAT family N-acetyltransferase [Phycisphaeraceae bacterium]|nr:GNAT family N-acetyltransferase [Phycisphaeraceae bacterium]
MNGRTDICFRRATADDAAAVTALYQQLSPDISNLQRDIPVILADPHSLCIILDVGGAAVGVAFCCVRTSLSAGRKMVIDDLVVDARYRNRGLGRALIQHLTRLAREQGLDCIELCCSIDKPELHTFYERLGFSHRMEMYSMFLT